jgi:predicted HicB family RNase H-like nuclease
VQDQDFKMKLFNHKGFDGSSEISHEDDCLFGKIIFIDDLITYEAATPKALEQSFKDAVDRHIAYCAKSGKSPDKP